MLKNRSFIRYIRVHNFKQFKGTKKIGPFDNFTSIVGANGTGKSSVLEAVAFGLAVSNPRFDDRNAGNLKSYGAGPNEEMYVEIIFEPEDAPNVFLKRSIKFSKDRETGTAKNESIYLVNRSAKNKQEYREYLSKSGLDPKIGSFWLSQSKPTPY